MIEGLAPEFASNEALKSFNTADDLAKSYLETHAKVASGSIDLLPEEVRKSPNISKYKTVVDLAKGYEEANKMISGIKRPPEKPDGYKFKMPDGVNPLIKNPETFQKPFSEAAHKLGLSEEQADGAQQFMFSYYSGVLSEQQKVIKERQQKTETALRQEWGADYDKNFNGITRALAKAAGSEAESQTVINEVGAALKGNPVALRALGKIVAQLSESTIDNLGGPAGGAEVDSENEYKAYAEAIRTNDQKHPLFDRKHKDYNLAQEKWPKLQAAHFSKQK